MIELSIAATGRDRRYADPEECARAAANTADYADVPTAVLLALCRYGLQRHNPGHFVRACLENDLQAATRHADFSSLGALRSIMRFIQYVLPHNCHGSKAQVAAWLEG